MGSVVLTLNLVVFAASLAPLFSVGGSPVSAGLTAGLVLSACTWLWCYYGQAFQIHALNSGKVVGARRPLCYATGCPARCKGASFAVTAAGRVGLAPAVAT